MQPVNIRDIIMSNEGIVKSVPVPTVVYKQTKAMNFNYTWMIRGYRSGRAFSSPVFSPGGHGKLRFYLTLYSTRLKLNLLPCYTPDITVGYECSSPIDNCTLLARYTKTCKSPSAERITEFEATRFDEKHLTNIAEYTGITPIFMKFEIVVTEYAISASPTVINVPEAQLVEDIGHLFETQKFSDVTINVCGQELPAHKVMLSMRSRVFAAMFEHEMAEKRENQVTINDMEPEVVKEMLRYIYTDQVDQQALQKMADKLLIAAEKYDLERLKLLCMEALRANLTVDNATYCLLLADLHDFEHLKSKVINFITLNMMGVMKTAKFKSIFVSHPSLIEDILRAFSMKISFGVDEEE